MKSKIVWLVLLFFFCLGIGLVSVGILGQKRSLVVKEKKLYPYYFTEKVGNHSSPIISVELDSPRQDFVYFDEESGKTLSLMTDYADEGGFLFTCQSECLCEDISQEERSRRNALVTFPIFGIVSAWTLWEAMTLFNNLYREECRFKIYEKDIPSDCQLESCQSCEKYPDKDRKSWDKRLDTSAGNDDVGPMYVVGTNRYHAREIAYPMLLELCLGFGMSGYVSDNHAMEVVVSCKLSDSQKRKQNQERTRKWNEENPGKSKEYQRKYHEENRDRSNFQKRKYYQENKEKLKEKRKEYVEKNREKIIEYNKKYQNENKERIAEQRKRYRKKNPEKMKWYHRQWRKRNKEKWAEYYRERYRNSVARKKKKQEQKKNKESLNISNVERTSRVFIVFIVVLFVVLVYLMLHLTRRG